jgi:hypothetical protein
MADHIEDTRVHVHRVLSGDLLRPASRRDSPPGCPGLSQRQAPTEPSDISHAGSTSPKGGPPT